MEKTVGECALCHQMAQLQKSHLIPQGIYKNLNEPSSAYRNPILVTSSKTVQTSEQVKDYLLCSACELLFQQRGEDWVMKNGPRRGRFLMREALTRSPNFGSVEAGDIYKDPFDEAFDLEKLIYFGASVFWRVSVHHWRGLEHLMTRAKLPESSEEALRTFLLHEDQFPTDLVMLISISKTEPLPHLTHPSPMLRSKEGGPEIAGYAFMIPGLQFRVLCGDLSTDMLRGSAAVPPHAVFLTDRIEAEVRAGAEKLRATSKLVGSLVDGAR
jgi:hypothetical protein